MALTLGASWLDALRGHPASLDGGTRPSQEERNLLRAIVASIAWGVYTTDLQGRIVSFNSRAERISGRSAAEAVGRHYADALGLVDETGAPLSRESLPLEGCIEGKCPVELPLAHITRPDGTRVPIALSTAPILDPLAAPAFCVAMIRDLSGERDLEHMKLDLISLVSHELRTPLAHIRGFASTLLQTDVEWDAETQAQYLRDIERQAERLDRLITDVLDLSRMQAGLLEDLQLHPVALGTIVEAARRGMRGALEGRTVLVELEPELPAARVDCLLMTRVLSNLLENAAKYSPDHEAIRVRGVASDGEVRLAVEDRGPGIPPEARGRIFEKFVRLHHPGLPRVPGAGLGLAICHGIVQAHGGRIWAEDRPEGGARFVVALPASDGDAQECCV